MPLTRAMTVKKKDPKDIVREENIKFGVKKQLNAKNKEKMVGLLRYLLDISCNYNNICFLLYLGDGLIFQDTEEVTGDTASDLLGRVHK